MSGLELWFQDSSCGGGGVGLFLDPIVPPSFVSLISTKTEFSPFSSSSSSSSSSGSCSEKRGRGRGRGRSRFFSVSLESKGSVNDGFVVEENVVMEEKSVVVAAEKGRGRGAMNTTKHLWSGAIAAMVSRTVVAPLERLKLEYILRGEKRNLIEVVKTIAASQGFKGFWKGNFLNILRTAPFKAVNFYAYDTYRKQLLKWSGNKEISNFDRFFAGAAAGITASTLCLPMDTIRTKLIAPGGEALGGVIGAFRYMIQTEGFFSLYRGLVPSVLSMAPAGAVFYGVYDMLKSAYLRSSEGRHRIKNMIKQGHELTALDLLELGPSRTLLYGAMAGACAEAATYPFEVLRRQLQMQAGANKLSALETFLKIIDQGGVRALYAGLVPSLLQVLPSAGISYFVYEFMKIVFEVE